MITVANVRIIYFFSLDLCPEEGGGSVELISGGRDVEVNATNVYDYVRKYAYYRMVSSQEKALEVWLIDLKKKKIDSII